ncbi:MAG: 3D domain-containing protein [Bryobacteraceae bacterium]|nr:3D domain-containing protein [Bryobacteraceae bacterium]
MRQSILLVAASLLATPSSSADPKHKQPVKTNERRKFVAFAYTSDNLTAEGRPPVPGITIAADPALLPLGSRVRISGASHWSGEYRVGDRGGKIKGSKVDIFVRTRQEAIAFGRRDVMLTVLDTGNVTGRGMARVRPAVLKTSSSCVRCGAGRRDIMSIDESRGSTPGGDPAPRSTRTFTRANYSR